MIRKILCVILLLSFLASSTACSGSKTSNGEVVKPDAKGAPELNIIMMPGMENWEKQEYFESYKKDFEKKYGVKVNYIKITNFQDGSKQLMAKLSVKNGPELVLDAYETVRMMIDSGAAVDVKGKIPNIEKIYSSFREKEVYFVPIGIIAYPTAIRKEMLEELQIPAPELTWTRDDYYSMNEKWLSQAPRMFTRNEFGAVLNRNLTELPIFDYQNKKANINTQEVKNALSSIRKELFSGRYKLKKDYSFKNYYNMMFEPESQEYKDEQELRYSNEYLNQSLQSIGEASGINMLLPLRVDFNGNKLIIRPDYAEKSVLLWSLGFTVNKNGANQELAYEFINGLLSDEVQMRMIAPETDKYEVVKLYPINSVIENKINDLERQAGYSKEALELKQYALQRIKNGEFELIAMRDRKKSEMYSMLIKDLMPFIFGDKEYSDEELSKELQKLEDKYNIYLSE